MPEVHVCSMAREIERMQADIIKGENNTKEITRIVSDIKDGHAETKFVMKGIEKTQAEMALADKESKAALALTNKENKELFLAGFKAIEDKRIEDEKAAILEKARLKALKESHDESLRKEKRAQTRAIWMVFLVVLVNTFFNLMGKYVPKLFK